MECEKYINKKKDFQTQFLEYIDDDDDNDDNFYSLIKNIENQISNFKQEEIRVIIHFIQHVSENHHRNKTFFPKMMKLLTYFKDQFKLAFSNSRLFKLFINNKLMLFILFKLEIIIIDENIFNILMNSDVYFKSYFYPEIESFICKEQQTEMTKSTKLKELEKLKKEMLKIDPNIFENFERKRQNGENDNYICELIREDLIEDFIIYHNKHNFSLSRSIQQSIFETNYILTKQDNTIIEYATFFGSIQIFQYLQLNYVELKSSLMLYAIHSQNADLVHILENNQVEKIDALYKDCLFESIKCHHNPFARYFSDIIKMPNQYSLSILNSKIFENSLCYCNYEFIKILNYDITTIQNLFKYDYEELVKICLNNNNVFDINSSFFTLFNLAMSQNNIEIVFSFLLKQQGIEKDLIKFTDDFEIIEIKIPSFIKELKLFNFDKCKSLQKVIIPESVEKICDYFFKDCVSLKEIIFPKLVKTIGQSVFEGCSSLKTLIIPDSVSTIGNNCFKNCISLTEIKIPDSVESIGYSAFENCASLTEMIIPDSVKSIGEASFFGCSSLEVLVISKSIKVIEKSCFCDCSSLKKVIIPASVKKIKEFAFKNCKSLTFMAIPYDVELNQKSFFHSNLTRIGVYSATNNQLDLESFQIKGITFEQIQIPNELRNEPINDNVSDQFDIDLDDIGGFKTNLNDIDKFITDLNEINDF